MNKRSSMLRQWGAFALIAVYLFLPSPGAAAPAAQYFTETNHTVGGVFWPYWQQHGGLSQQGYPISDELQETSDLNGQTYTVQYFERAVFEQHPENPPPYNVLLSLLGVFHYNARYGAAGAPGQQPSTANPRYFPQTGHTLGGSFRTYWETHGGLAQQGYPISDEFTEVSELDGKPYTVQYFERAIFELHPENQPPYNVLLSQLGTFQYRQKHGNTARPGAHPVFMESGSDNGTLGFYSNMNGTVASDTGVAHTGPRSVRFDSTGTNNAALVQVKTPLADTGRRTTLWFRTSARPVPGNYIGLWRAETADGTKLLTVYIDGTTGKLGLLINEGGGGSGFTTQLGDSVIAENTWYRMAVSYVVNTPTRFTVRLWLDGTLQTTFDTGTLATTGTADLLLGPVTAGGANISTWIDDVYVDDGNTLDDPGDVRVTVKLPAGPGAANQFESVNPGAGGGNRWDLVADRPPNPTRSLSHAGAGLASENFRLQSPSMGDVDLSRATILAYQGYIYAKLGAGMPGSYAMIVNGADTPVALTTTDARYAGPLVSSSVYPAMSAGIGLKNTGTPTGAPLVLSDCGVLIAYRPVP